MYTNWIAEWREGLAKQIWVRVALKIGWNLRVAQSCSCCQSRPDCASQRTSWQGTGKQASSKDNSGRFWKWKAHMQSNSYQTELEIVMVESSEAYPNTVASSSTGLRFTPFVPVLPSSLFMICSFLYITTFHARYSPFFLTERRNITMVGLCYFHQPFIAAVHHSDTVEDFSLYQG